MNEALKEYRELAGMDRRELAEALGDVLSGAGLDWWPLDEWTIARWEDVGFPIDSERQRRQSDIFSNAVIGPMMEILGAGHKGLISTDAPPSPRPGDLVLNPAALEDLAPEFFEFLLSHADELDLQMAVPNRYDTHLKPYAGCGPEDLEAIGAWMATQIEHNEREAAKMARLLEFHQSQLTDKDEGLTLGEAYERHEEGTARMEELLEGEASEEED
jgi:transcriptional regulator with XRE-family HTH domain